MNLDLMSVEGTWHTSVLPKPLVTMMDYEPVASITDSAGNDPQECDPRARRAEPSKDLEDRVRFGVDRVVLDHNHAGQRASALTWPSIIARPVGDCCAAKRKIPLGSRRTTNLTQALQRLHTPSNRMRGSRTRTSIASGLKGTAPGSRPPHRRLSMPELLLATLSGAMRCMSVSCEVGPLFCFAREASSGLG
jgi:hypothetical protein